MKFHLSVLVLVVALAACKKEEPAPAAPPVSPTTATTATPNPSPSPTQTASAQSDSTGIAALAGEYGVEDEGKLLPDSNFKLSPNGDFEMTVTKDGHVSTLGGTATVEGDNLKLAIKTADGKASPDGSAQEQKLIIAEGGKKLVDPEGRTNLIRR